MIAKCLAANAGMVFALALLFSLAAHAVILRHGAVSPLSPDIMATEPEAARVVTISFVEPEPEPLPPEPEVEPGPEARPPEPEVPNIEEVVMDSLPPPPSEAAPAPVPARPASTPRTKPSTPARPPAPAKAAERSQPSGPVVLASPQAARNPPPRYPETARRNGWEGMTVVRAEVNASGRVTGVALHRGSGYAALDQAALQAVRTWCFQPKTIGGVPVGSTVEVPVNFSLRR